MALGGIFSIIHMIRHTRLAEEQGKRELLGSNVTGSLAPLAAALLTMLSINAVATLLTVLSMTVLGFSLLGSLAHCLGFCAAACVLGILAGVIAQFFAGASAARGMAFGALGTVFGLHILWNVAGSKHPVGYLNPLEWPLLIRPFAGERFVVLLIALAIAAALATFSLWLMKRRDVGAGLFPQRKGRAFAKPGFSSLYALAWRTQKGLFLSWLCFYTVFSFALGCASYLMVSAVSSAEALADLIARLGGVDRAFMSLMLYILAMIISIYVLMAAGILRREEIAKGELLLALPVRRDQLALSHLVYVFGASAVIALVSGLCVGLGAAISTGDPAALGRLFLEMATKIPAIWTFGGISLLLFGVLPRWMTGLNYSLLTLFVALEILWEQKSIPDVLYALSPFSWVTPLKASQPVGAPILLCGVTALLVIGGIAAFRRRDAALH